MDWQLKVPVPFMQLPLPYSGARFNPTSHHSSSANPAKMRSSDVALSRLLVQQTISRPLAQQALSPPPGATNAFPRGTVPHCHQHSITHFQREAGSELDDEQRQRVDGKARKGCSGQRSGGRTHDPPQHPGRKQLAQLQRGQLRGERKEAGMRHV
jgi:hypothetical protein